MTTFDIKLLAAILMVCDHVGAVFFPNIVAFRVIGRFSFPLFAWLIGQGEKYTKNFSTYLIRLTVVGIVSQPIYYFVFNSLALNILATLSFGLLAVRLDKITSWRLLFPCVFAALAQITNSEYGAYGVFVIFLLAKIDLNNFSWWVIWILLNFSTLFIPKLAVYQLPALLAPIILIAWNGKQGRKAKWFYFFYPLHLIAIFLVRWLVSYFAS